MSLSPIDVDHRPKLNPALFADNRKRAMKRLQAEGLHGGAIVFGLPETNRPLSDFEHYFRQESCMFWMSGANEPDSAIYVDIDSVKSVLFVRDVPEEDLVWFGEVPTHDEKKVTYGVDEVLSICELPKYLEAQKPSQIYTLEETFRPDMLKPCSIAIDYFPLLKAIGEERQIKSSEEMKLIQYACDVNCAAFRDVFKKVHPGMWAHQAEAILQHHYIDGYCRYNAFATIVCTGTLCSILHYHDNDRKVQDGELMLIDAGCEYNLYSSDNTRTIPCNGKFSPDQRLVYQAVLNAHNAVIKAAKPGAYWPDVAVMAAKVMAEGLIKAGLFNGTPDEVVDSGALAAFYPHGLGHGMGLDCHEIQGWPLGKERPNINHVNSLRMGRTLVPGICVTDEPGCYFVPRLYEAACKDPKTAKFINRDVAVRFGKSVGGVRIEDDLHITESGCEVLSNIPKEIDAIEAWMAAK